MTASRLGAWIAAIVFAADQATKLWGLFIARIVENGPIQVTSFLELTEVWNRGISYGLFQQHTEWGRWLLIIVSAIAAVGFSVWLARIRDRILAIALGLLIGGAIGNLVDRVAYGAVFDFIHFHWGSFSWYVFNIADAAIVAGVVGLLYDAVRSRDDVQRTEGG